MADSRETLIQALDRQREEKAKEEQAIRESMQLLERVDRRRRESPGDRRRWDLRANDLEEGLLESRRRLGWVEQRLVEATRKLESAESGAATATLAAGPDSETPAGADAPSTPKDEIAGPGGLEASCRTAALQLLDVPLFKVSTVPFEDIVLAKLFCESEDGSELEKGQIEELLRRIKMNDRRRHGPGRKKRAAVSPKERRHQFIIRKALDKCRSNQMETLTLHEIDLVIGCYDMIEQRDDLSVEDVRLLELINRAIDHICAAWSRLETLRDSRDGRPEE